MESITYENLKAMVQKYVNEDKCLLITDSLPSYNSMKKIINHIKSSGYFVTGKDPSDEERKKYRKIIKVIAKDDGYNAQRTSMDLPIIKGGSKNSMKLL